jgi:hypothetical protein
VESVQAALDATREAIRKADAATEKRFDAVNEFRKALSDQTATFLPRTEYDTAHDSLAARVGVVNDRIAAIELRLTSRLDVAAGQDTGESTARAGQRLSQSAILSLVVAIIIATGVVVSILAYARK